MFSSRIINRYCIGHVQSPRVVVGLAMMHGHQEFLPLLFLFEAICL